MRVVPRNDQDVPSPVTKVVARSLGWLPYYQSSYWLFGASLYPVLYNGICGSSASLLKVSGGQRDGIKLKIWAV